MPVELVIGVVGLAVQILETSSKIKEFIRVYKDAPRELQRLALKVDHAESMCSHIKKLFEQEDFTDAHVASLSEAVGASILQSINATLDELSEMLVKFQARSSGKLSLKSAGWSWMDKKDRVQRLMGELESDLNILTQTMTTNIYSHINVIRQQLVVQPTAAAMRNVDRAADMSRTSGNMSDVSALALKNMMNPSGELVVSTTSESVNMHALPLSLSALFKHRKVSKKTRWNDSIETNTVSETKSVTFSHPYLDYRLKLTYRFGSLCQPSYALTVPHIINLRAPDWKSVGLALDSALWGGDVGEIQQLMSAHQITPRTKLSGMWVGGDDGGTLFEHAMVFSRGSLCHFLAQQDQSVVIHDEDEVDWPRSSIFFHSNHFDKKNLETMLQLLAPSYHRSDPVALFEFLASPRLSPEYILNCYEFCRPQAINRLGDLVKEATSLCRAAWEGWGRSWMYGTEDFTQQSVILLLRLRDDGLELHARVSADFEYDEESREKTLAGFVYTLRQNLLHEHPYKWESVLFTWLEVVKACGIDVEEYMEVEVAACQTAEEARERDLEDEFVPYVNTVPIVRSVYGLSIPTFEAQALQEGPANEVCLEFASIGLFHASETWSQFRSLVEAIVQPAAAPHRNWKTESSNDEWPFAEGLMASVHMGLNPRPNEKDDYRVRDWQREWEYDKEQEKILASSFVYAQELREKRFERRQRKRLCRMGLEEWPRKGGRAMPGAWVLD